MARTLYWGVHNERGGGGGGGGEFRECIAEIDGMWPLSRLSSSALSAEQFTVW